MTPSEIERINGGLHDAGMEIAGAIGALQGDEFYERQVLELERIKRELYYVIREIDKRGGWESDNARKGKNNGAL